MMRDGIISNQRGIGFFVAPEAKDIIIEKRRSEFFGTDLPYIAHQMRLLGISAEEILRELKNEDSSITYN